MLKLHQIPESSRRDGPEQVSRDFPLIVSRPYVVGRQYPPGHPMQFHAAANGDAIARQDISTGVRLKADPRPAVVLNLLTMRSAKHRDRVFEGAYITGFGDNLGSRW